MTPPHLASRPKRAEGGPSCQLLHPKEGPSHVGNLKACPLFAPKRLPTCTHQGHPPFQVAASSFPKGQWAWVPYGISSSSKNPNLEPLHSAILESRSQGNGAGEKPGRLGRNHQCSFRGMANLGACPLPGSVSSSVKWEWWHPPYEEQERLTLGTTSV